MIEKIQKLSVTLFLLLCFSTRALAQDITSVPVDFSIGYDVKYSVDENFIAKVTKKGLLTNLSSSKYVPYIDLQFDAIDVKNLNAYDDFGTITPVVDKTATSSSVRLTFNKPILGIGKKLSYTIEYTDSNILTENETEKILKLPKIGNDPHVVSYNVTLILPKDVGKPTFVDPPIRGKTYYWEKDQIESRGVTLIFPKVGGNIVSNDANIQTNNTNTPNIPLLIILASILILFLVITGVFIALKKLKNQK